MTNPLHAKRSTFIAFEQIVSFIFGIMHIDTFNWLFLPKTLLYDMLNDDRFLLMLNSSELAFLVVTFKKYLSFGFGSVAVVFAKQMLSSSLFFSNLLIFILMSNKKMKETYVLIKTCFFFVIRTNLQLSMCSF